MQANHMRRVAIALMIVVGVLALVWSAAAQSAITAEAIGQANLRGAPDINAPIVGQIVAGTRYPVVGRSELYPWLLLADPATNQPMGWAFQELLNVQGIAVNAPISTTTFGGAAAPITLGTATPSAPIVGANGAIATPTAGAVVAAAPSAVTGAVQGEINIRYGPGVEYPRIGVARAGETLAITARHTQLPWVQIAYAESPNGAAWVALEVLQVTGNLEALPSISAMQFALPSLTPTASPARPVAPLSGSQVPISPAFQGLADTLWSMMLAGGFDPATSTLGSLFVMDVESGEAMAFGDEIAFSGMSVNKIAILMEYYRQLNAPPDDAQAYTLAEAMVCSENISTNELLAEVGGGNPYRGAEAVTAMMDQAGLTQSFLFTPYANDPFITPQAPAAPRDTTVDQAAAQPDPYNQMTVSEMGGLLNSVYQCAANNTGALITSFSGEFTQNECRHMLDLMSNNQIGALIEAGVPSGVPVAHKHGWINDTHGDAAIVFSPGGTYILVVALHNPVWLAYENSFPLIEELSRTVYNHFNPAAPLAEVRAGDVPATCELLGDPIVEAILRTESSFNPVAFPQPTPTQIP